MQTYGVDMDDADVLEPVGGETDRRADIVKAMATIDVVLGHLVAAANPRDINYRGDSAAYRRDRRQLGKLLTRFGIDQPFPFETLDTAVGSAKAQARGTGAYAVREAYFKSFAEAATQALKAARNDVAPAMTGAAKRVHSFTDTNGVVWRYDPSDVIGEGGAGVVYRGLSPRKTVVAVKRVEIGSGGELARRIHARELEIGELVAGGSSRDHLLVNLGVALDESCMFIAMPLADESLAKHMERAGTGLPISEVVAIVRDVAMGLQELAEIGVVHRDLKPDNILRVGDNWQLADFGIARDLAKSTAQWTRKPEGTAEYMAPERIEKGATTARSDLYALGVIAFELLTGKPLYIGDDVLEVHRQHVEARPPPLPNDVPELMQRLVYRLLAKEPADRHADARAVADALDSLDTPFAAWQHNLTTAALNVRKRKDASRETEAHAQRNLRQLADRRRLAVADLDDLISQALVQVKAVLGADEVALDQMTSDGGAGYTWILSWDEYALVATAEISPGEFLNENNEGYPLLVGSLTGAKREPRLPSPAFTAQRLAANLIYFHGQDGGRWVKRVWRIPFIEEPGGLPVTASLWRNFTQIRDAPILAEGFIDTPINVETLIEPLLNLLNEPRL